MKPPASIYTHCDELGLLPAKNRENWMFESARITELLPQNATVLQVGCANGSRLIDLQKKRSDVHFLGIDIEEGLLSDARSSIEKEKMNIETRLCDITSPEQCAELGKFDAVLCLNNTLGYIPDEQAALRLMRSLGTQTIVSVYGPSFTDGLAKEYFTHLGLDIDRIEGDRFFFKDFSSVKRYTKREVEQWKGKIEETPIGSFCILQNHA